MADRPFQRSGIADLEALVESAQTDLRTLEAIELELEERSTARARQLKARVAAAMTRARQQAGRGAARTEDLNDQDEDHSGSSGTPTSPTSGKLPFDAVQREIIDAAVGERLMVSAPPGTGKTAVACARVASLLDKGIPGHRIWLFSFTRTAVRELRNRIQQLASARADVHAVKVTTLDSRTWTMVQGFSGTRLEAKGYEQTIESAMRILDSDDDAVFDFVEEIDHLIVDEAQDLVGVRRDFVLKLLSRVPETTGVTVLTDDAQAIYGFGHDEEDETDPTTLPEVLRTAHALRFREVELRTVYRTSSNALKLLYIDGRKQMMGSIRRGTGDSASVVRECVKEWNDGFAAPPRQQCPTDGSLQLYRSRLEVLDASSWFGSEGKAHRLRLSGLPISLHPWIALAVGGVTSPTITEREFADQLERAQRALGSLCPSREQAWGDLCRVARSGNDVDMNALRRVLSRQRPPLEFTTQDTGLSGPIVGTIHASKGREADHVELMLAPPAQPETNADMEARVVFVGATRAKVSLKVGKGQRMYPKTANNRQFIEASRTERVSHRARVEIGRDGDVQIQSPVDRSVFPEAQQVEVAQSFLTEHVATPVPLRAWRGSPAEGYLYGLRVGDEPFGQQLGRLSNQVNIDLFSARQALWPGRTGGLATWIGPLLLLSVRTIVLDAEDPLLEQVHEPWRSTGIWLAPIVIGLPYVPF